jgi:hypothetical protein
MIPWARKRKQAKVRIEAEERNKEEFRDVIGPLRYQTRP